MTQPKKQQILIVDDEEVNRKLLSNMLKDTHELIMAENGEQALHIIEANPDIDLILLDVMMPEIDGFEVLECLKELERAKDIPVIFITALISFDNEEKGLRLGAVDYIYKPFRPAIVRLRIENQLHFVRQRKLLQTLVGQDGLTEIANRRRFDESLAKEWKRSQRNGLPLSLLMVDIDFFKLFNDHYGHAHGDLVLKSVAQALAQTIHRPSDLVARYGGEEFVLLLADTNEEGARIFAEKARTAIESLAIDHVHSQVASHITVSIGGATSLNEDSTAEQLLEAADAMLYQAKAQGRNRVVYRSL